MNRIIWLAIAFAALAAAQPRLSGIQNNYSYLIPGTPNYAIAQGSIFVLYGQNMAPADVLQQGFNPSLNPNLGGVSIKVTAGGVTKDAIPYYVSAQQIAAILPSSTPVGPATLTVTFNGQTSPPLAFTIVQSAFGILTLGGNGLGNAAVQDTDFNYITPVRPARPGQAVIFWGTGQGPDPNDETRLIAAPRNLANLPFEFYIANKSARVLYHGRSTFPGLDQIVVEVPEGVSGCYVSAYAKTGDYMSNFVSFPVARSGACADWFSNSDEVTRLLGTGRTEINMGWFYLAKFQSYAPAFAGQPARMTIQDSATAQFLRNTPFDSSNWGAVGGFANPGCIVTAWRTQSPFQAPFLKNLDAGVPVTLTVPDGTTRTLNRLNGSTGYSFSVVDSTPGAQLFIPPTGGGTFRFRTPGGPDIGVADATITATEPLVWNEHTSISTVSRTQPLTVTWRGGTPGGLVIIQGGSFAGATGDVFTSFGCTVPVEEGRFTVPRDVIASMVPSLDLAGGVPTGTLLVQHFTFPKRFTAEGLDHGSIVSVSYSGTQVHYR